MGSTVTLVDHAKVLTLGGLYGIVSLGVAGLLASVVPQQYVTGVLVGWILAIFIIARVLRARYLR